jgi:hypothetical protein
MSRIKLFIAFFLASSSGMAAAQTCPALQFTNLTSSQQSCQANCCSAMTACYAADGCRRSVDWPRGLAGACQVCNREYLICSGLCMTAPEVRQRYTALQSSPECVRDCAEVRFVFGLASYDSDQCGIPDGCGGSCSGANACSLFVRWTQLYPILF